MTEICDLPAALNEYATAEFTANGLYLDDGGLVWRLRGPGYPAPKFLVYATGANFLHLETAGDRDAADAAAAVLINHLDVQAVVVLPVRDRRGLR